MAAGSSDSSDSGVDEVEPDEPSKPLSSYITPRLILSVVVGAVLLLVFFALTGVAVYLVAFSGRNEAPPLVLKTTTTSSMVQAGFTTTTAPAASCTDGIKNQNEDRVDCGGVCPPCPTCWDSIKNQGEAGVDCGGPCPTACATCSDGIQNQAETGVDCGGPCAKCPTCFDGLLNQGETQTDCGGPCAKKCPSCSDSFQNQGEEGVDCGGPCPPCRPDNERYALCLSKLSTTLYLRNDNVCPHCKGLKDYFKTAIRYINVVDCQNPTNECTDAMEAVESQYGTAARGYPLCVVGADYLVNCNINMLLSKAKALGC
ncbi:Uncharacterised protein [uncultured archaeon]|nr:Uncharacterised protein [uncultured archaeon]